MLFNIFYNWGGLNRELFYIINRTRGPFIDRVMLVGTQLGDVWNAGWITIAMLLLIVVRSMSTKNVIISRLPNVELTSKVLSVFIAACLIAGLLVWGTKTGFNMPRPYAALPSGSVTVLTPLKEPYSLPSGHAALAMLVAWVFWPHCQHRWRFVLTVAVAWVGISRISVGAHFPMDVLVGYFIGGISAWLATKGLTNYSRRPLGRG